MFIYCPVYLDIVFADKWIFELQLWMISCLGNVELYWTVTSVTYAGNKGTKTDDS